MTDSVDPPVPSTLEEPAPPAPADPPAPPEPEESEGPDDEVDEYRMTLLEHLVELRNRLMKAGAALIVGMCISLPFGADIFRWLTAPADGKFPEGSGFIYTEVAEKFLTDLKMGIFGGLFIAMPVIAWQIWGFVAPGLYKRERLMVIPFAILSTLLFVGGASFCYYGILPYAMDFFLKFAADDIEAKIKVSSYLTFVTRFIIAFGVVFETPLAIFFLARMGLVTAQGLRKFRRYAIVLGFVLAALITPPDPGSQVAVGLPFILLYEIGIVTAALWGRPPLGVSVDDDEEDEAEDEPGDP